MNTWNAKHLTAVKNNSVHVTTLCSKGKYKFVTISPFSESRLSSIHKQFLKLLTIAVHSQEYRHPWRWRHRGSQTIRCVQPVTKVLQLKTCWDDMQLCLCMWLLSPHLNYRNFHNWMADIREWNPLGPNWVYHRKTKEVETKLLPILPSNARHLQAWKIMLHLLKEL